MMLKEAITQAPILCYPDPEKRYIVYTDASDDACGAQLSQEHNGTNVSTIDTSQYWSFA